MKTLLILRHAKAENRGKETVQADHPRTLTERGRAEASEAGTRLAGRGVPLDLIVSSDARRAYQTAVLAAAELPRAVPIRPEPLIYDAGIDTLLKVVGDLPDRAGSVMVVGHNPGFESLAEALSGQACALPTGAVACVTFAVDHWSQVREGTGTLAWLDAPGT